MSKTLSLPKAADLALVIENELQKLPSDALHNHFHQLSEQAATIQEEMAAISLASLILCALELESIKGNTDRRSGLPWKDWVKNHCDFSHMSATRYARVLKCARSGLIPELDPSILPETPPSLMSGDELKDSCRTLAEAMRGLGGRRQLYLQLGVIALPGGKLTNEKHNPPTEAKDIEAIFFTPLKQIEKLFTSKKHLKLKPPQAADLINILQSQIDELKLIK